MGVTVETKRRRPMQPIAREPANKPRPIGISQSGDDRFLVVHVLYDDGTVWQRVNMDQWELLPPIPQGYL